MADQPNPLRHLPGDVAAIDGEIRRLDDIKEQLWSIGDSLRTLTIDDWAGPARDTFDDFRYRFAHQWLVIGDQHDDAARALERYQSTLIELCRRAATADLTTGNSAALADIARWNDQLDSEAHTAAITIRRACQAFADLPRMLSAAPLPLTTPAPERLTRTTTQVQTKKPDDNRRCDPRLAPGDPIRFRHQVRELSGQILAADFITVQPGGSGQ